MQCKARDFGTSTARMAGVLFCSLLLLAFTLDSNVDHFAGSGQPPNSLQAQIVLFCFGAPSDSDAVGRTELH